MNRKNLIATHRRSGFLVKYAATHSFIQVVLKVLFLVVFLVFEVPGADSQTCLFEDDNGDCQNSNYQDIFLTPNDPIEEDCFRFRYPIEFYSTVTPPAVSEVRVQAIRVEFEIQGEGLFEPDSWEYSSEMQQMTNYNLTLANTGFGVSEDRKKLYWVVECNDDPGSPIWYTFPLGNQPLSEFIPTFWANVLASPGETVGIQINYANVIGIDNINTNTCANSCCDFNHSNLASLMGEPGACASGLTLGWAGMPSTAIPAPHDEDDEVTINLMLTNATGNSITITEADFQVKIIDLSNNLDIAWVANNDDDPYVESYYHFINTNGEEENYYYFHLSAIDPVTIANNGSTSLVAFTIKPPDGVGNLFGQADIEVEHVTIATNSYCCELSTSALGGSVEFEGYSPCDASFNTYLNFGVEAITSGLAACEAGFTVTLDLNTNVYPNGVALDLLLLEFQTSTSGDLMLDRLVPSGLSCVSTPVECSSTSTCLQCDDDGIVRFNFDNSGSPITLQDGAEFDVIFSGLNGCIESVELLQAAIKPSSAGEPCIPEVSDIPSNNFPICNGCNFCSRVSVQAGTYQGSLSGCEAGFSVSMNVLGTSNVSISEIVVEFELMTTGTIANLAASALLGCGGSTTNGCNPSGQCVTVSGNVITYHYCPSNSMAPGNYPLVDVSFTSSGGSGNVCVNAIKFTDATKVVITSMGECVPQDAGLMGGSPFPVCSACNPNERRISGRITTPGDEGVSVTINANLNSHDIICEMAGPGETPTNPISGVIIRDVSDGFSTASCPCEPYNCSEIVTNTFEAANDPCGSYTELFTCASTVYSVLPKKDINPLNGVTTFDLFLIQKHILAVQPLNGPYKLIAADANNSGSISTFDLLELRKLILIIYPQLPKNTSWRFIDKSFEFGENSPFSVSWPECIEVDFSGGAPVESAGNDFYAIKIGDVNSSATVDNCPDPFHGGGVDDRSENVSLSIFSESPLKAGETATMEFWITSLQDLVSCELGLHFDPRYLQLEEAIPGELPGMNAGYFGTTQAIEGSLRALWYAPDAQPSFFKDGLRAFNLRFKVLRPVEDLTAVLALDDAVLPARAYEDDGTEHGFHRNIEESSAVTTALSKAPTDLTVAAVPNPFTGELRLFITLPEDDWIEVSVFTVNGRLVASWSGETEAKQKEILFANTKDWGEGVFTYRVRTASQSVTGKITKH